MRLHILEAVAAGLVPLMVDVEAMLSTFRRLPCACSCFDRLGLPIKVFEDAENAFEDS